MKSTGMVRRVDELGRIVIPIELRRTLDIKVKDTLEIFVDVMQSFCRNTILPAYCATVRKTWFTTRGSKYAEAALRIYSHYRVSPSKKQPT